MLSGNDTNKPIRVIIADDHPIVREGLLAALSAETDIKVVGEARDGREAEELALKLNPDVIIMDIFMPGRSGLQSLPIIKQKLPGVKVLILTVSDREDQLFQAIRFGADGYLLKKSDMSTIVGAVRSIAAGEAILSPQVTANMMRNLRDGTDKIELTAREQQVLELAASGLTNAEIAVRLFISQNTVNTHVYRLLQKLHMKNIREAIAYSIRRLPTTEPY